MKTGDIFESENCTGRSKGGGARLKTAGGRGAADQTESLMVLILSKATVEMKASLHSYPAVVTLTLGQSLTSDPFDPSSLAPADPPVATTSSLTGPHSCRATFLNEN